MVKNKISYEDIESSKDRRWQTAMDAYISGDFAGALFIFSSLEREGEVAAQLIIPSIYEEGGGGVERDYIKALEWYEKALYETEHPKAYIGLGRLYYNGLGVERNYKKAFYYFSQVECDDQPGVLCQLGRMYQLGHGVKKDTEKAIYYFNRAINNGHLLAARHLALLKIMNGNLIKGFTILFKGLYDSLKCDLFGKDVWRINCYWKE